MAEALLEVTDWGEYNVQNLTYLLDGDKCLAVMKPNGEVKYFDKPLQIDKRRRKFKKVANQFKLVAKDPDVVEVVGSKGTVYSVNKRELTCSCPGFSYRGTCKHIEVHLNES